MTKNAAQDPGSPAGLNEALTTPNPVMPLRGLQFKSTILVVCLVLIVAATSAAYVAQAGSQSLHGLQQEMLAKLVATLADTVSKPLVRHDRLALQTIADEAANGSPLVYVRIEDTHDRPLATARHRITSSIDLSSSGMNDHSNRLGRPTWRQATRITPAILETTYPVTTQHLTTSVDGDSDQLSDIVGYVRAGIQANAWQGIITGRMDALAGGLLVAALLALPLGFIVVRRVVAPLHTLSEVMNRFSRGNLDARSEVNRVDEIGMIQSTFNRMAGQHERTYRRLLTLNAELEHRVTQKVAELRQLVVRDTLTSLFNRRYLNEALAHCLAEALRYGQDLTCIMLDLDDFKNINDTLGHQAGDRFLKVVANTIHAELRQADVPARFGGDEFVILLPQTSVDQAYPLAERIMQKASLACTADASPDILHTMSVGIACLSALQCTSADELIREADRALYQAKAMGKNRIVVAGQQDIRQADLQPL